MQVKLTYCSNYNGVDLMVDGNPIYCGTDPKMDAMTDEMAEWAYQHCDDDEGGLFVGDFDELTEQFTTIAKKHLGDNIEVVVVEDSFST